MHQFDDFQYDKDDEEDKDIGYIVIVQSFEILSRKTSIPHDRIDALKRIAVETFLGTPTARSCTASNIDIVINVIVNDDDSEEVQLQAIICLSEIAAAHRDLNALLRQKKVVKLVWDLIISTVSERYMAWGCYCLSNLAAGGIEPLEHVKSIVSSEVSSWERLTTLGIWQRIWIQNYAAVLADLLNITLTIPSTSVAPLTISFRQRSPSIEQEYRHRKRYKLRGIDVDKNAIIAKSYVKKMDFHANFMNNPILDSEKFRVETIQDELIREKRTRYYEQDKEFRGISIIDSDMSELRLKRIISILWNIIAPNGCLEEATQSLKIELDKEFGQTWNCVCGTSVTYNIRHLSPDNYALFNFADQYLVFIFRRVETF
ncbi:hypothetical protein SNEBB_004389 [Seison nebaliae]|nr:hypothetical protein SNEBB_004389 [Seison nebaliae]